MLRPCKSATALLRRRRFQGASDASSPLFDVGNVPDRSTAQLRDRRWEVRSLGQLSRALTAHPEHLGQLGPAGQAHQFRHGPHGSSPTTCQLTMAL